MVTLLLSLSPDCSFTCHYRCRALVQLDCGGPPGAGDEDDGNEQVLEKDTNVVRPGAVCEGGLGRGVANLGAMLGWGGLSWAVPCEAMSWYARLCQARLCPALLGWA